LALVDCVGFFGFVDLAGFFAFMGFLLMSVEAAGPVVSVLV
jgi:hypothetical protein